MSAASAAQLPTAQASVRPETVYATLLDLQKCIGCGACVEACRERNALRYPEARKPLPELFPPGVRHEDWSGRRDVVDRLTPYNWLFIESVRAPWQGKTLTLNIPRRCMHCLNPPCAALCPWGAASRHPATGTVNISPDICLGGAKCRTVCPWHVPQRQSGVGLYLEIMPRFAGNGVMYKCDRCADGFSRGETPACIAACPEQVQSIGPRSAILAEARTLARERGEHLYGVADNGGTNTFYLSPIPFETLAKHAQSGPGRPTSAPTPDSMANVNALGRALLTIPFAGVAAGALRAARRDETRRHASSLAPTTAEAAGPAKKIWVITALALGFSGMMQMPVAARYGLTKIPGLAWTGDFYAALYLHYVFAGALLLLGGFQWGARLRRGPNFRRLTTGGGIRLAVVCGLAGSGVFCVVKNLAFYSFDPSVVMAVKLTHLVLAATLGIVSSALWIAGRGAWSVRSDARITPGR